MRRRVEPEEPSETADPADYGGSFDVASRVDARVTMSAINERVTFAGPLVTGAFRFWFDNPSIDYGYALRLAAGSMQETKLDRWESGLNELGPVLTITYELPAGSGATAFIRGDCDGDGSTGGVTDAIVLLGYNFLGTAAPDCRAACDVNGDGDVRGVTDAIYFLQFNFLGGPVPVPPFPECGTGPLPSDAALGCDAPPDCP